MKKIGFIGAGNMAGALIRGFLASQRFKADDIWVADKGSDMVVRFDPAGRVKMVFGRKPEASDEVADKIKQHVRERHSAYAYPREIEFVADLPKTLTGKIRRVELREQERERKAPKG